MAEITNDDGWVTLSTSTGSGNTTITATINEVNTGRNARSVVVNGSLDDYSGTATATITQDGIDEFVQFSVSGIGLANGATQVSITGTSNSSKLTFTVDTSGSSNFLVAPETFGVVQGSNNLIVDNGVSLDVDYGENGYYTFTVTYDTNDAGTPSADRTQTVIVTANSGVYDECDVTQAGVDSTMLFDGLATQTYNVTNLTAGQTQSIAIGVTPSGADWTLTFDE